MNSTIPQEQLKEMLDLAVRKVTEETASVQLFPSGGSLSEDVCTVHITFNQGFYTSLTLCADTTLLFRMARNVFGDDFDPGDLEDFSKEYFNVLCGKIAGCLKEMTNIAARFSVPTFYRGRYTPKDQRMQFVLTYSDDQCKGAQLGHHVPCPTI